MIGPMDAMTQALLERLRAPVESLCRDGWDATVVMEQPPEPGVRIVSIDVKLTVLIPASREPQPKPGLSMRHAGKPGGVVTLRQETGASTGGLDQRVPAEHHVADVALDAPAVLDLHAGDLGQAAHRLDHVVGLTAVAVPMQDDLAQDVRDGRIVGLQRISVREKLGVHSFVSSLVAAHHKRRRRSIAGWLPTLLLLLVPVGAAHADTRAGGGRVPCPNLRSCRAQIVQKDAVIAWQQHDRRHLALVAARAKTDTPSLTVAYACEIGQVVYHVRASHCELVVWCESRNDRHERNSATATGFAQYEDATWASTAFAKAGFSVYDTVPSILAMDAYAARYGFDTSGGWAASYGCHHLSGPEA